LSGASPEHASHFLLFPLFPFEIKSPEGIPNAEPRPPQAPTKPHSPEYVFSRWETPPFKPVSRVTVVYQTTVMIASAAALWSEASNGQLKSIWRHPPENEALKKRRLDQTQAGASASQSIYISSRFKLTNDRA
jgi:hypothetical protein